MSRVKDQLRRERHQHADEIERLRGELADEREKSDRRLTRAMRAEDRIEELEKRIIAIWEEHGYKITTDQIRAAWKEANATSHLKYQNVTLLRFLERHFNIIRCKECRGAGDVGLNDCAVGCPDCDGEGWKMEADDE